MAKPSYDEWVAWARGELQIDYNAQGTLYRRNIVTIHSEIQRHAFFERLPSILEQCALDYTAQTGYPLFTPRPPLNLEMKDFINLLNKVYRKNCLWNPRFPRPPKEGWVTPDNWYESVDDMVRGLLVCRYADGPARVTNALMEEAERQNLAAHYRTLERDEGYYAYHVYVCTPVKIMAIVDHAPAEQDIQLHTEIQITTQLHEALRDISHEIYAKRRLAAAGRPKDWKWDFSSRPCPSSD